MEKGNGYSTKKRSMILEYLKEHGDSDISVKDIEEKLIEKDENKINVTTIYRYLDKLVEEGKVLKHANENGRNATFQYVDPEHECQEHLHMKCLKCGIIYHMDCDFMEDLKKHVKGHHNFSLECKSSMLYGYCAACQIAMGRED